jgi:formylglycine-generating enzyme required for sulfatase activity
VRREAPVALARVVERCLEKDPAKRYGSGQELLEALSACQPKRGAASVAFRAAMAAALIAAIGAAGWFYYRFSRGQWVRNQALPQIRALILKDDYIGAFDLIRVAQRELPDEPELAQHWAQITFPVALTTEPPGAEISYRRYADHSGSWRSLGRTPLRGVRVPGAYMEIKVEKPGFETMHVAAMSIQLQSGAIGLLRAGSVPSGMVAVPQTAVWAGPGGALLYPEYFIDRYEVTNRDYQRFVDAGGYRDSRFWPEIRKNGGSIAFAQVAPAFRDGTGRQGPAGWELGKYPKDQADFPVTGISWFEAWAYCKFVGKQLPTVRHWAKVIAPSPASDIVFVSNYSRRPAPVGSHFGLGPFGTYDTAGNAKEWLLNESGAKRAMGGGGWNEPEYMYRTGDAQDPFAREVSYGCRCALYPNGAPAEAFEPVVPDRRDYGREEPASDYDFAHFRKLYDYDEIPLDSRTEYVNESNRDWRKEKVSFRAAYGDERIPAYLYLPRNSRPPFQTVLWMPGYAMFFKDSESPTRTEMFTYLLSTGRAVLHTVYKGHYERPAFGYRGPNSAREVAIQVVKDARRSVDYLCSRSDIRHDAVGYMSLSDIRGPVILALEPRIKTGIFISSGLVNGHYPLESDPFQFLPRVKVPILMINGKNDFFFPPELQEPMFRFLGGPRDKNRYQVFPTGHVPPLNDVRREVLNWLDRQFGAVETTH